MRDNCTLIFEHLEVSTSRKMESVYIDGYFNFGWELENSSVSLGNVPLVTLKFLRDPKHKRKAELTRLQRQFESCVNQIIKMERSKDVKASTVAYILGVLGIGCIAGSVFAALIRSLPNSLPLILTLAIPGLAGCIIPYFCYVLIRKNRCEEVDPLIENKYEEIYSVCEKAHSLLAVI